MARLFFALWPGKPAQAALDDWSQAAAAVTGGRRTQRRNLHLTLAFLGETDARRIPELQAAVAGVAVTPCNLRLERCQYWKHNRVVWAGGDAPPKLLDMVAQLRVALDAAGVRYDRKAFVPHVTLVRNARAVPDLPRPNAVDWPVRDFVLVASGRDEGGPVYRVVAGPFGSGQPAAFSVPDS